MTTVIAIILFAGLVAGYPLHLRAMRKAAATAEVRAEMRTQVYAETAASQRITIGALDARVGRLKDELAARDEGRNVVAFGRRG